MHDKAQSRHSYNSPLHPLRSSHAANWRGLTAGHAALHGSDWVIIPRPLIPRKMNSFWRERNGGLTHSDTCIISPSPLTPISLSPLQYAPPTIYAWVYTSERVGVSQKRATPHAALSLSLLSSARCCYGENVDMHAFHGRAVSLHRFERANVDECLLTYRQDDGLKQELACFAKYMG